MSRTGMRYSLNDPCTVLVRVKSGSTLMRKHRVFNPGDQLRVTPGDAKFLVKRGTVERVEDA